jgi:hypothetical protein
MNTTQPHIDEILQAFFEHKLQGRNGPVTRRRIHGVHRRLLNCLEAEAERVLVTDDLVLLAGEREFGPPGAMARTMHAEDLLFGLDLFVREPWLDPASQERQDQRVQLRLTSGIVRFLIETGLIDRHRCACPLIELESRIRSASSQLYPRRMPRSAIPGALPWG